MLPGRCRNVSKIGPRNAWRLTAHFFGDVVETARWADWYGRRWMHLSGMENRDEAFWKLLDDYRVFAVFDEIHHCVCYDTLLSNAWCRC